MVYHLHKVLHSTLFFLFTSTRLYIYLHMCLPYTKAFFFCCGKEQFFSNVLHWVPPPKILGSPIWLQRLAIRVNKTLSVQCKNSLRDLTGEVCTHSCQLSACQQETTSINVETILQICVCELNVSNKTGHGSTLLQTFRYQNLATACEWKHCKVSTVHKNSWRDRCVPYKLSSDSSPSSIMCLMLFHFWQTFPVVPAHH